MSAPNSFSYHLVDETGQTFLHTLGRLGLLESTKAHGRWWLQHARRPTAYLDKDRLGRPLPRPIGRVRVVVELYHDASSE